MSLTHLSVLQAAASLHPSRPAFRLPCIDPISNKVVSWDTVTYGQFQNDVELYARAWTRVLSVHHIPTRSIIGLWIGGYTYNDVLHIYGMSRAGYIPQLFSLRLPNPEVIYELLDKSQAKALVYSDTFQDVLNSCPVPTLSTDLCLEGLDSLQDLPEVSMDDTAFFFHTSGSTSGSPKLIPYTYRWLKSAVHKNYQCTMPRQTGRQVVATWMGSMCHVGQTSMLMGWMQQGACVIQPTSMTFDATELTSMIHDCGLTHLSQFAAFLAAKLREAKTDEKVLSLLSSLDDVIYSGMPLPAEEEDWAYRHGIHIRNLFGTTECGAMMLSVGGTGLTSRLLRPLDGSSYEFRPIEEESGAADQSTGRLLELIVRSESGDCPHTKVSADGHYHLGDLFVEPVPGHYLFRGRNDDWIKSENSLRCDTKAIEDNVNAMCGKLISACIVVGSGRPSPVLFVEPVSDVDEERLKKDIVRRTRPFHARRYLHERITSPNMVVVVPAMSLPRTATKGNIRRQLVEEQYSDLLDSIFKSVAR